MRGRVVDQLRRTEQSRTQPLADLDLFVERHFAGRILKLLDTLGNLVQIQILQIEGRAAAGESRCEQTRGDAEWSFHGSHRAFTLRCFSPADLANDFPPLRLAAYFLSCSSWRLSGFAAPRSSAPSPRMPIVAVV